MKKRCIKNMRSRAFTLLELLMVVIIIAILATIALPQYIKASERARAAKAISWLGAIRSAELRYVALSSANIYADVTNWATVLDITMAIPSDWDTPVFTVTAPAGGNPPTGVVILARDAGQYDNQTLGITLGNGILCGTFAPYFATAVPCTAD